MPDSFQELIGPAIVALPQDLKATLRLVEDPELDDASRVGLAGAVMHVLSGANSIPGVRGILAFVDDVVVLRLALEAASSRSPDVVAKHAAKEPEFIGNVATFLVVSRDFLGELMPLLEKATEQAQKLTHQGHGAQDCVFETESSTWLYDAVHAAIVEQFEFDEDEVMREVKRVGQLQQPLGSRAMRG